MKKFKFFQDSMHYFDGVDLDGAIVNIIRYRRRHNLDILNGTYCYDDGKSLTIDRLYYQVGLDNDWVHITYTLRVGEWSRQYGMRIRECEFY